MEGSAVLLRPDYRPNLSISPCSFALGIVTPKRNSLLQSSNVSRRRVWVTESGMLERQEIGKKICQRKSRCMGKGRVDQEVCIYIHMYIYLGRRKYPAQDFPIPNNFCFLGIPTISSQYMDFDTNSHARVRVVDKYSKPIHIQGRYAFKV